LVNFIFPSYTRFYGLARDMVQGSNQLWQISCNKKRARKTGLLMVPKVGVEPTWAEAHYALNVARLPVPPLRQGCGIVPLNQRLSIRAEKLGIKPLAKL
jgi:hypothetical protein